MAHCDSQFQEELQSVSVTGVMLEQSRNILYGAQVQDGTGAYQGMGPSLMNQLQTIDSNGVTSSPVNPVKHRSRDCSTMGVTDSNGVTDHDYIPQWAIAMQRQLGDIQSHFEKQNNRWNVVEKQLNSQSTRMSNIENQISQIGTIKQRLDANDVKLVKVGVDMVDMQERIKDYDKSVHYYSETCDDLIRSNTEMKDSVEELSKKVDYLMKKQVDINIKQSATEEKLLDIQWRSMRENLIFTGLAEHAGRGTENCENKVREFINTELGIQQDISFDRVHRLGRFSQSQRFDRPIVAKFTFFKDKEMVRATAARKLQGSRYGVREHFPAEIEEKRKQLYGEAKIARQNESNKVRLVRDKLYINGKQFIPGLSDDPQYPNNSSSRRQGNTNNYRRSNTRQNEQRVRFGANPVDMQTERYNTPYSVRNETQGQYRSQQSDPQQHQYQQQQQQHRRTISAARKGQSYNQRDQSDMNDSSQKDNNGFAQGLDTPTANRYSLLSNDENVWSDNEQISDSWSRQPSLAGKTKPSSPLDSSPKRQREYSSDTSHSEVMDHETSRDTGASANGTNNNDQYTTRM